MYDMINVSVNCGSITWNFKLSCFCRIEFNNWVSPVNVATIVLFCGTVRKARNRVEWLCLHRSWKLFQHQTMLILSRHVKDIANSKTKRLPMNKYSVISLIIFDKLQLHQKSSIFMCFCCLLNKLFQYFLDNHIEIEIITIFV